MDALGIELLDGDNNSGTGLGRSESPLVDPSFVDFSETAFAEDTTRTEVLSRRSHLREAELPQVRILQNSPSVVRPLLRYLARCRRRRRRHHRRRRCLRRRETVRRARRVAEPWLTPWTCKIEARLVC